MERGSICINRARLTIWYGHIIHPLLRLLYGWVLRSNHMKKIVVVSDEILTIASAKKVALHRMNQCLEVNVCPQCGETIKDIELFNDGGTAYKCSSCGFKHTT